MNFLALGAEQVNGVDYMRYFIGSFGFFMFLALTVFGNEKLQTNWGAVLKVPIDQTKAIDQILVNWGNWIKETHPLDAKDKNNLEYLSITKGEPASGHIYYVIVEVYPTNAGLMNHQRIFRETSGTEKYKDIFTELRSVAGPYFVGGATQRHSVFKLVPSQHH